MVCWGLGYLCLVAYCAGATRWFSDFGGLQNHLGSLFKTRSRRFVKQAKKERSVVLDSWLTL